MNKQKEPQKTAAQIESAFNQTKRLLILSALYLDCWFVTKLQSVLLVHTTVINPFIDCSDRDRIDALIDLLYPASANTDNALNPCRFWLRGWFGMKNIVYQKFSKLKLT